MLFWPYLGQILLKFNDPGHFFNSRDKGLFKNVQNLKNRVKFDQVMLRNICEVFFAHPLKENTMKTSVNIHIFRQVSCQFIHEEKAENAFEFKCSYCDKTYLNKCEFSKHKKLRNKEHVSICEGYDDGLCRYGDVK